MSCNGQTITDVKKLQNNPKSVDKAAKIKDSVLLKSAATDIIKSDLKLIDSNPVYKLTYLEKFNTDEESLSSLPHNVKAEFLKLLDQDIYYSLTVKGQESLYQIIENARSKETSLEEISENTKSKTTLKLPQEEIYKNFNTNIYIKKREFLNKDYLIKDNLNKLNWVLKNETIKIGDFNCKKALLSSSQGATVVWYTDQIPLNEGPSMYYGLPGLIIKVEAKDRDYSLIKFEKLNKIFEIEKPSKGLITSLVDFEKIVEKSKKSIIEENIYEDNNSE